MTATVVDGKKVEAAEPTKSGLWTPEKPIFFLNTMELLLEDGSTTYGCRFCDYTDDKMGRVRVHQVKFCENNPNPPSKEKAEALRQAKRDRAKAKVQKAEPIEGVDDILSMLEAAFKPSDDDKAEVTKLKAENATITAQRDKVVEALNEVLDVLQKHGFIE